MICKRSIDDPLRIVPNDSIAAQPCLKLSSAVYQIFYQDITVGLLISKSIVMLAPRLQFQPSRSLWSWVKASLNCKRLFYIRRKLRRSIGSVWTESSTFSSRCQPENLAELMLSPIRHLSKKSLSGRLQIFTDVMRPSSHFFTCPVQWHCKWLTKMYLASWKSIISTTSKPQNTEFIFHLSWKSRESKKFPSNRKRLQVTALRRSSEWPAKAKCGTRCM